MTYEEAIHHINKASGRELLYPVYLRLERMTLLFAALDLDVGTPAVHIAGTSGKGSTSTLTAAVLTAAGYKVGLHTTPHLQTPRERMLVNGQLPSKTTFTKLSGKVYQAALQIERKHSYGAFNNQELLFAIAALHFKEEKTDINIVETFMGGQYDPTNLIKPLVSVVTNVDLDHTKLLGRSLDSIALVKAGVIKAEVPFITGATQLSVVEIFKRRAVDLKTSCLVIGEENLKFAKLLGQKGSILSAQVLDNLFADLHLNLLGKHQINNALMVLYITQVLRSRGWLIPDQAIRTAFAQAFIPGRLEIVQTEPTIVLDGAHNPAKTKALALALRRIFPKKKIIFVFAMKKGKDLETSLKPLIPLAAKFFVTRFSEKRSHSTTYIHRYLKSKGLKVTTRLNPSIALDLAKKWLKSNQIICVTGSLYLVGRLRDRWYPNQSFSEEDDLNEVLTTTILGEVREKVARRSR